MKKVLIIGFLFGVFVMPFVMAMGMSLHILPLSPFTAPGVYFSMLFYQEQPTRYAMPVDKTVEPIPLSELSDKAQKYVAEHPTTPQPTPLSKVVRVITDGIYSALIFWIIYSLVKKLRNKTSIQG